MELKSFLHEDEATADFCSQQMEVEWPSGRSRRTTPKLFYNQAFARRFGHAVSSNDYRTMRGGSFDWPPTLLKSRRRMNHQRYVEEIGWGFRLARRVVLSS